MDNENFMLRKIDEIIEKVYMKGLEATLMASADGTEIIHHRLLAGTPWALIPEQGWTAMESVYILSGRMKWHSSDGIIELNPGDFVSSQPILKHSVFIADMDTEFMYTSSQPVFYKYHTETTKLRDLAISVEENEGYTSQHCEDIRRLSLLLGKTMGLSSDQLYELNFAAFFHDIGKVSFIKEISNKGTSLTEGDWSVIKLHPIFGKQMLKDANLPHFSGVGEIVEQHHERYNGSGYPYGLKHEEIGVGAYILGVVDSFVAMTSNRLFKSAKSKDEALGEILSLRGILYHPLAVDALLNISNEI